MSPKSASLPRPSFLALKPQVPRAGLVMPLAWGMVAMALILLIAFSYLIFSIMRVSVFHLTQPESQVLAHKDTPGPVYIIREN